MRWQHRTWGWVWVGSLAACHSGGAAAPDGKTPAATAEPVAEGAPAAGGAGASATDLPPTTPPVVPVEPATSADPASAPNAECETRRAAIEAALSEAGRCASDAQCTLTYPNCPFGCARPISTSANLDALQANIEAFKAACNSCVYRCMPPKGAPTCNAGRCSFGDG